MRLSPHLHLHPLPWLSPFLSLPPLRLLPPQPPRRSPNSTPFLGSPALPPRLPLLVEEAPLDLPRLEEPVPLALHRLVAMEDSVEEVVLLDLLRLEGLLRALLQLGEVEMISMMGSGSSR